MILINVVKKAAIRRESINSADGIKSASKNASVFNAVLNRSVNHGVSFWFMNFRKDFFMFLFISFILPSLAFSQRRTVTDAFQPVDPRQVKVGGEIGRRIDVTINNNLLKLNIEKDFLKPFRNKEAKEGDIGLGRLIDATVRFAVYSQDEKVIALKRYIVDETIKTQLPDGYIGIMVPESRLWKLWDIFEIHYIAYGLTNDYHYFGEKRSLEAARKLADYIIERWETMPTDWEQQTHIAVHEAIEGLERTMMTLYNETNDHRYLDFCTQKRNLQNWNLGIVIGRRELIEGHVSGYFCTCTGQLDLFHLTNDERCLRPSHHAVHFLTAQDGACITGGAGQCEIFTGDQDGRGDLAETCATAYQLRVYEKLMRLEGNSYYGDLIERTIYNTLFAAQSPDGSQIRYYTPLEGNREYFKLDTYCCPGHYRRIISELPTMVYYRSERGVAVSLYTDSQANIDLDDGLSLKIQQETDYPSSGRITIGINPSRTARFPLKLRIPRWCKEARVSVNGKPWEKPITYGDFLTLDCEWTSGDKVILDMEMPWRAILGRKRQSGRVAMMRGPMVFCLDPDQDESLKNLDAADLNRFVIDVNSIQTLTENNEVHSNGIAGIIKAGKGGFDIGVSGDLTFKLTEFPNPAGKVVYFRVPDLSVAVPDELFSGEEK